MALGSPHCQNRTNGRSVGDTTGTEVVNRPRDPSLPRVYEDPDEIAASNQVKIINKNGILISLT